MKARQWGYSLIELMIVVAIVGLIAAVMRPSYQGHLCDTYRTQARTDMEVCVRAMKRFFSNGFSYAGAVIDGSAGSICSNVSPAEGTSKFEITLVASSRNDFTLQAAPIEGSGKNSCRTTTTIQVTADGSVSEI
jgi:type IV pilus assembly protein PilE